jgi:alkanesulfonate monooxygenase SsuD/methylene tetrahydromethanopterin reductase-like flavin-dependent oxidoreductase (luciferase family)
MVERARAAAGAGLDSFFVGDHHATGPGLYYQNTPILGRLLAEWDGPVAGALFLLPLWNPVVMAEQIGTLASFTAARFVLQTAIGGGAAQFAGTGTRLAGRTARFEAGLDVVRRLCAGETVSARVGDQEIVDASIAPVPPEPIEVWVGGTAAPAIARAARLGDGWLADAGVVPDEAREQAEFYAQQCGEIGRVPTAVAIRRDIHIGASHDDAARVAEPVIAGGYRGFRPSAFIWGDVDEVAAAFADLAAQGYSDVIVRQLAAEQSDALASIERLADARARVARI